MNSNEKIDTIVRVEVTDEAVIPGRSGNNDRGPWTIPPKQPCYLWQGDRYPTRIEIAVPNTGPRRPGFYLLGGVPFKVGVQGTRVTVQFDDRGIDLIPLEEVAQALSKPPLKAAS